MTHHLYNAAQEGNVEKVKSRLGAGDDVNYVHKNSCRTSLCEAAWNGHLDIVKFLVEKGAEINFIDKNLGYTPLGYAAWKGHLPVVQYLIQKGADVNAKGNDNPFTPLMEACRGNFEALVALLLQHGADTAVVHKMFNKNALSFAQEAGYTGIVQLLKDAGATLPADEPEITAIPWPQHNSVDYADPQSVLYAFINAMHQWEDNAYKLKQSQPHAEFSFTEHSRLHDEILKQFCTEKKRTYSAAHSVGWPYDFSLEEKLIDIQIKNKNRQEFMTQKPKEPSGMRYEKLYVLLRKGDKWLVDSYKTRVLGHEKWNAAIL